MMDSEGTERASIPYRVDVLTDPDLVFHIMESVKDFDAARRDADKKKMPRWR